MTIQYVNNKKMLNNNNDDYDKNNNNFNFNLLLNNGYNIMNNHKLNNYIVPNNN